MNKSKVTPLQKAAKRILSSILSTNRASLLKRLMKAHRLSFSPCTIFSKLDKEHLCLCPLKKLLMNNLLNSWNEVIMFGGGLPNHTLVEPFNVVGKALYMISFGTPWSCIVILNVVM